MKFKLIQVVVFLSCMIPVSVFAAQSQKEVDVEKLVNKITARTNELENEVKLLKAQLSALKQEQRAKKSVQKEKTVTVFNPPKPCATERVCCFRKAHGGAPHSRAVVSSRLPATPYYMLRHPQPGFRDEKTEQSLEQEGLGGLVLHGTAVVTSPYLGRRSAFDGSDLIVLNSGTNQDVRLLKDEKKLREAYKKFGYPFPPNPVLEVSGRIETQAIAHRGYDTINDLDDDNGTSDINLTGAELDMVPVINEWVTGLMIFKYDNSFTTPRRISNSRLFLDTGFATIGDFSCCPWYASFGQMFVPFAGQYSSFMLTLPLPQQLGDVRARAVLLGYQPLSGKGLYGSIFAFRGDTFVSVAHENNINNGGLNLGFKWDNGCGYSMDIGGSYIVNIADALGFQNNGGVNEVNFTGFNASDASEELEHTVPGLDLHANFSICNYRLFLEYVDSLKDFAFRNLNFNDHGARPGSANIEGAYKFNICQWPASVAVGYARTWQALALNLPEQRYNAVFNISFWKDTIASVEYRHDINYPNGTTAGGNGPSGLPVIFFTDDTLGRTADQLTLQFGIYF